MTTDISTIQQLTDIVHSHPQFSATMNQAITEIQKLARLREDRNLKQDLAGQ